MKCEICGKADAVKAIVRETKENEQELYVCEACAEAERLRHQKKSHRTRQTTALPPDLEKAISEVSGSSSKLEPPPAILGEIMNAFHDMVSHLEQAHQASKEKSSGKSIRRLPASRIEAAYRVCDGFHLEGLSLIGELEAVRRALHALKMDLVGRMPDGVREAGHVYTITYRGSLERAKRIAQDLLREERNARIRLVEEMPRVFGDAICRALAVLKNCRLLSPGEFFDLLSPLRLAAREQLLDGITATEVEKMMGQIDLSSFQVPLTPEELDRADAYRADEVNKRFVDVMLNEKAERRFLK